MVAEVGVHVDEEIVVLLHGVAHAGQDGGAEAELAGAVHDVHARIGRRHLVGQLAGAVGRIVVDDQHVRRGQFVVNSLHERTEVVALVVGGQRNQDARFGSGRRHEGVPRAIVACVGAGRATILHYRLARIGRALRADIGGVGFMVSKMVITCTGCGKKIEGPVSLQGKKIRCKVCATVFTVTAAGGKTSPTEPKSRVAEEVLDVQPVEEKKKDEAPLIAVMPDDEDEDGRNPYGITDHAFAPRCPHCANDMETETSSACHCGYNIETRAQFQTVKTIEHTGADWTLWLAPGILCVLADISLIVGIVLLWTLIPWLNKYFEEEWWNDILFGFWAQLWGTVLFLFLMFFAGRLR